MHVNKKLVNGVCVPEVGIKMVTSISLLPHFALEIQKYKITLNKIYFSKHKNSERMKKNQNKDTSECE